MPWCPNCKIEYKDGVSLCADCGQSLVQSLEDINDAVELCLCKEEETAKKLTEFLIYSHIQNASCCFYEKESSWLITVGSMEKKEALKLYHAFLLAENEKEKKTISEDLRDQKEATDEVMEKEDADITTKNLRSAPSVSYVKKREQYQDLKSTAWMFSGFGILVLIFVILHLLKILTLFSGILSHIMLALMGFGMIYVGINSFLKAKKTAGEAVEEEALTEKINAFLQERMTKEYVAKHQDENQSEEINFLNIMEHIKEDLKLYFGEIDESYLDQLAEEFYNQHFEDNRSMHSD